MTFILTLSCVAILIGILFVHARLKERRFASLTWNELLGQFQEVPMSGIAAVALDFLRPGHDQLAIEPEAMWKLIGGAEGLRRMEANAEILLQLAALAEQWNPNESVIVGERMRREALKLRQAVKHISRGMRWNSNRATIPFHMQEAASVYYLMRERLLALYAANHAGRHGHLLLALGSSVLA